MKQSLKLIEQLQPVFSQARTTQSTSRVEMIKPIVGCLRSWIPVGVIAGLVYAVTANAMSGEEAYELKRRADAHDKIARDQFNEAVQEGDAFALYVDADYLQINGAPKAAIEEFQKSAKAGNGLAEIQLGTEHIVGLNLEKDSNEAAKLFASGVKHISESNDVYSLNQLALYYQLGHSLYSNTEGGPIKKDLRSAFLLREKAARLNSWEAVNDLSISYRDGLGITRDQEKADTLHKQFKDLIDLAAINGDVHAMQFLAYRAKSWDNDQATFIRWTLEGAKAGASLALADLEDNLKQGTLGRKYLGDTAQIFRRRATLAGEDDAAAEQQQYAADAELAERELALQYAQ